MESCIEGRQMMIYFPILFVFIPVLSSLLVYLIHRRWAAKFLFVSQAAMIVLFILYAQYVINHPDLTLLVFGGWDSLFAISFYNDGLSLGFIGLTVIMWFILLIYTYKTNRDENKFLFFFMFLQGIFLGLIQTNDLFNLFVFLELMTVLITILIAYKKTGPSFKASIFYLLVNTIGAMFFLLGIILIYYVYGTINIQYLADHIHLFSEQGLIKLAYVMMISGLSIKAAFFPLFTWLPKAHGVAQSTISALLSGLIVKGALYMFIRIHMEMFESAHYGLETVMFYIGAVTAIGGVIFALVQKDLKQILAYHTVSQIGIMVMGLSSVADYSYIGGLMHIFNHALFKSLLFLGAGVVIQNYHTKKVSEIRGVMRSMPWTGVLLIVGMLSISGAPLFNGFVSKTLVKYDFKTDDFKMILFTIINIGTVTSFLKFSQILFGQRKQSFIFTDRKQQFAMTLIAILCILIGIFYIPLGSWLLGKDLSYVNIFDVTQWIDYAIYVMAGLLLYRYVIVKDFRPLVKIRNLSISFENANYLFILYMVMISIFMFMIV
jgi:multicomponent Na+:H+ antiporter subunit D